MDKEAETRMLEWNLKTKEFQGKIREVRQWFDNSRQQMSYLIIISTDNTT